jgi:malate dehydrogenase (oxaloacetate-decarboxylating)
MGREAESAGESSSQKAVSAGYSVTFRLRIENRPGSFAKIVSALADIKVSLAEVSLIASDFDFTLRDVTVSCRDDLHAAGARDVVAALENVSIVEWQDDTFAAHAGGKLHIQANAPLVTVDDLSRAYTPGVARVCQAIHQTPEKAWTYTIKRNSVAVVTDGSAVLGLGNIGPAAALPVMEGKAILFKQFANIDAYPLCLNTQDTEEIIRIVKAIAPGFGGINLEDIAAPRCFEIEERLRAELDIPVFHDDQHGTAIVVLAGLLNALKIVNKRLEDLKVVICGFGAGGVAIARLLYDSGVRNIIPCDSIGAVYRGRTQGMNPVKDEVISYTNPDNLRGTVSEVIKGADVFIGVSQPGTITRKDVASMAPDAIVFALANPIPEILPHEIDDIVRIVATGRSDYANQINNVLAFPGIFRGALDCFATTISAEMKVAAAEAIAGCVLESELSEKRIIPSTFFPGAADRVAEKVKEAAIREKLARPERYPVQPLQGRHDPLHWRS